MEHNLGKYDKIVRIGIGVTLIIVGLAGDLGAAWLKWLLLIVGIVLTLTGVFGFCPCYKVCKISTNKVSDADMQDLMK